MQVFLQFCFSVLGCPCWERGWEFEITRFLHVSVLENGVAESISFPVTAFRFASDVLILLSSYYRSDLGCNSASLAGISFWEFLSTGVLHPYSDPLLSL